MSNDLLYSLRIYVRLERERPRTTKILTRGGRKRARFRVYTGLHVFPNQRQDNFSVEKKFQKSPKNWKKTTKLFELNGLIMDLIAPDSRARNVCFLKFSRWAVCIISETPVKEFWWGLLVRDLARSGRTKVNPKSSGCALIPVRLYANLVLPWQAVNFNTQE